MGFLDKLKESFGGDDKPKSFEVTFTEKKMGMTLSAGKTDEAVVTAGDAGATLYPHANAREVAAGVTSRGQRRRLGVANGEHGSLQP